MPKEGEFIGMFSKGTFIREGPGVSYRTNHGFATTLQMVLVIFLFLPGKMALENQPKIVSENKCVEKGVFPILISRVHVIYD